MRWEYKLVDFGHRIRRIRENNQLARTQVSKLTGINTDTIRRIEKGEGLPKQDTLDLLSHCYKYDIAKLFLEYRDNYSYSILYEQLDRYLVTDRKEQANAFCFEILDSLKDSQEKFSFINKEEKKQFALLLEAIIDNNHCDFSGSIHKLTKAIAITNPGFQPESFRKFTYNLIELKALFLMACNLIAQIQNELSNEIFFYLLEFDFSGDNSEYQYLIKSYLNISYNFFLKDDYWNSWLYAVKGIKIAGQHQSMYCLYALLARGGSAMYRLNIDRSKEYFERSIIVLELLNYSDLQKEYESIIKDNYPA